MRIAILSRKATLYSTSRLIEACRQRGADVTVLDPLQCVVKVSKKRRAFLLLRTFSGWKSFFATRIDVATGKPHNFIADALGTSWFAGLTAPNCAGTSALQSSITSLPATHGWQFIGPQKITGDLDNPPPFGTGNNQLQQHIGQHVVGG